MSAEGNKPEGTGSSQPSGEVKTKDIQINVDLKSKSLEDVIAMLKDEEAKRKASEKSLTELQSELTRTKTELDEKTTEADSSRNKLQIIAEKKFAEKKLAIEKRAKELIKDEDRLKEVVEKVKTPEDLQATEFMLETLSKAMAQGQAEMEKVITNAKNDLLTKFPNAKDKIEAAKTMDEIEILMGELKLPETGGKPPAGTAPLTPSQTSSGAVEREGGYDSYEAMIRDLRKRERSGKPEEAAEAKQILNELFKKWASAVKKGYEGKAVGGLKIEAEQPSLKEITGQKEEQEKTLRRRGVE